MDLDKNKHFFKNYVTFICEWFQSYSGELSAMSKRDGQVDDSREWGDAPMSALTHPGPSRGAGALALQPGPKLGFMSCTVLKVLR